MKNMKIKKKITNYSKLKENKIPYLKKHSFFILSNEKKIDTFTSLKKKIIIYKKSQNKSQID